MIHSVTGTPAARNADFRFLFSVRPSKLCLTMCLCCPCGLFSVLVTLRSLHFARFAAAAQQQPGGGGDDQRDAPRSWARVKLRPQMAMSKRQRRKPTWVKPTIDTLAQIAQAKAFGQADLPGGCGQTHSQQQRPGCDVQFGVRDEASVGKMNQAARQKASRDARKMDDDRPDVEHGGVGVARSSAMGAAGERTDHGKDHGRIAGGQGAAAEWRRHAGQPHGDSDPPLPPPGAWPNKGHDSKATQMGNMLVTVSTSATGIRDKA